MKMHLRSPRRTYLWAALVSMLAGMAIYAFFRNIDGLIVFRFLPKPGFLDGFPIPLNTENLFVYIFLFQRPDVLWFLSGLFIIRAIWIYKKKWMQIYIIAFSIIAITNELLQISPYIPGTFDILDLLFICISAFLESVFYYRIIFRRIKWAEK